MKFGKQLAQNRIPGWEHKYIRYDVLKRQLKGVRQDLLQRATTAGTTEAGEVECRACGERLAAEAALSHLRQEHRDNRGEMFAQLAEGHALLFDASQSLDSPSNTFWRMATEDVGSVDQWFIHQLEKLDEDVAELAHQLTELEHERRGMGSKYNYRLKQSSRLLRAALRERYVSGQNLVKYGSFNHLAVRKIVKKHDKMTNVVTLGGVLEWTNANCSFASAERVVLPLLERMETLYAQHFTDGNEGRARRVLRRNEEQKPSRGLGFVIGLCGGASIVLLVWSLLAWLDDNEGASWPRGRTVFLLFRLWFWPLLGLWYLGVNIYVWQRGRVNFVFIFGHVGDDYRKPAEVLALASMGTALWSLAIALYVATVRNPDYQFIDPLFYALLLTLVMVAALVWPLHWPPLLFRSSRLSSGVEVLRLFASGFVDVTLMDFFVADQLTSVVPLFEDTLFQLCVASSDAWDGGERCLNDYLIIFRLAVDFVPSWMRMAQCLRRWRNEEGPHMLNALKYLSQAPVVVFLGLNAYLSPPGEFTVWTGLLAASLVVAQYFRLYWDYFRDWRVFSRRRSPNFPIRAKTLYPLYTYYLAIATNFVLRHVWIFAFYTAPYAPVRDWPLLFGTLFGFLEVTRRFQWNVFRIETEQITNTGRYRQTKDIPLLFERGQSSAHATGSGDTSDSRLLSPSMLSSRSYSADDMAQAAAEARRLRDERARLQPTIVVPRDDDDDDDQARLQPTVVVPRDEDDGDDQSA